MLRCEPKRMHPAVKKRCGLAGELPAAWRERLPRPQPQVAGFSDTPNSQVCASEALEFLVELAGGARDENSAGNAALPVLYSLYDASGLSALGAIGAFGCVHHLLTICCFRNLNGHF